MENMRELLSLMEARNKGGYVVDSLIEVDENLGVALGGLVYRLDNKKSTYEDYDKKEIANMTKAAGMLDKARKMVGDTIKLIDGIDLQFTGRE